MTNEPLGYEGDYYVWGPPGTGKTRFLKDQVIKIAEKTFVNQIPPVIICSLTKTAAQEIASRDLPLRREQIATLHSLAFHALEEPEIAELHVKEWNAARPDAAIESDFGSIDEPPEMRKLNRFGSAALNSYSLYRAQCIPRERWGPTIQTFAEDWEEWKTKEGYLDFTDLIEAAYNEIDEARGSPEIIIIDEAQDLSALELLLINKWSKAAGASIRAGDPWQALYTWRGARPEMFTDESIPDSHKKNLPQSYRVSKAVRSLAMDWMRRYFSEFIELNYKPTPEEGRVENLPVGGWKTPQAVVPEVIKDLDDGKSVMIVASCSYMLDPTVAFMREEGIPFANPWRVKRSDWNPLGRRKGVSMMDRLLAFLAVDKSIFPESPGRWTFGQLQKWVAVMQAKTLLIRGAKKKVEDIEQHFLTDLVPDRFFMSLFKDDELQRLFELVVKASFGYEGMKIELIDWFEEHVMRVKRNQARYLMKVATLNSVEVLMERARLWIGTIHSFKGAEADSVFLYPDLSPESAREWIAPDRRDNVARMFYVGITRARTKIVLCNPSSRLTVPLLGLGK